MFDRLDIYLHEMFPLPSRIFASIGIFAGVYIGALYVNVLKVTHFGFEEIIGILTVFLMLLTLRIVDEFKDEKTDRLNFPNRPLPSGRVKRSDLMVIGGFAVISMLYLNLVFMPNKIYFLVMFGYGCLMSVWFFAKKYIQPNLLLALITHNPIQLLIVFYILSITGSIYSFSIFRPDILLLALIFYIPGLAWEISRKIRLPKEENRYVTYSRIFGRAKAIRIVMIILFIQLFFALLVYGQHNLDIMIVGVLLFCIYFIISSKNSRLPRQHNYGNLTRLYIYAFQSFLIIVGLAGVL